MDIGISFSAASSAAMLLGGVCSGVFFLLRRASHLLDTVRGAAEFNSFDVAARWKDVAFSVYDVLAIFNVSLGILAVLEIAAGLAGLLLAVVCRVKKTKPKGVALPSFLGVLCVLFGAAACVSLLISNTSGAFLTFALILTQLVVPVIFTIASIRQIKLIKEASS